MRTAGVGTRFTRYRVLFCGLVCLFALTHCATKRARVEPVLPDTPDAVFAGMVARLRAGDSTVDFTALRIAYTRTSSFDPYAAMVSEDRAGMVAAINEGDNDKAAELAGAVLEVNFVDAGAHIVSMVAHDRLGHRDRSRFHQLMAEGLIRSIGGNDPGRGRTPEAPYVVISVREEYDYLQANGLKPAGQALVQCNGRPCDAMDVIERKSGRRSTLYFDVSIPMEQLQKAINPGVE